MITVEVPVTSFLAEIIKKVRKNNMETETLTPGYLTLFKEKGIGFYVLEEKLNDKCTVEFQYYHDRTSNKFWARVVFVGEGIDDGPMSYRPVVEFVPKQYMSNAFDAMKVAHRIYCNQLQALSVNASLLYQGG